MQLVYHILESFSSKTCQFQYNEKIFMKTLEILVPQYKETDDVVKPLLDSIAIQQNVDFDDIGVIICNDGSDAC